MLAAQKGDVKVAGVLIDGGADILIEDYVSNYIGVLINMSNYPRTGLTNLHQLYPPNVMTSKANNPQSQRGLIQSLAGPFSPKFSYYSSQFFIQVC